MKLKLISLVAAALFPVISQADVVFLNKNNTSYNLEVTYKFCNWQNDAWKCGPINTARIESGQKNYIVIPAPELPVDSMNEAIFVQSAVAKDNRGNVAAQGSYDSGVMLASLDTNTGVLTKESWIINFSSILGVNAIGIDYSQYQYVGPEIALKKPAPIIR